MVDYTKNPRAKGHTLGSGGPRDRQIQSANSDLINRLQDQLSEVTRALSQKDRELSSLTGKDKIYSQAEFESILQSQLLIELEKAKDKLKQEYVSEIATLSNSVKELTIKLAAKEELVEILSKRPVYAQVAPEAVDNYKAPGLPELDKVVIDPSESTEGMTPHIKVDSVTDEGSGKENLGSSVNKLKNILGKKF